MNTNSSSCSVFNHFIVSITQTTFKILRKSPKPEPFILTAQNCLIVSHFRNPYSNITSPNPAPFILTSQIVISFPDSGTLTPRRTLLFRKTASTIPHFRNLHSEIPNLISQNCLNVFPVPESSFQNPLFHSFSFHKLPYRFSISNSSFHIAKEILSTCSFVLISKTTIPFPNSGLFVPKSENSKHIHSHFLFRNPHSKI